MSPYWQEQLEPFNRGVANLSAGLMQLPRLRAQAALYAARQQEQQLAAQEAAARTQLLNAQTSGLIAGQLNDQNLTSALKRYAVNPQDTDAQADVISGFGQVYKKDPQGTARALGDLFAQFAARNGSTNYANLAALQGNAAAIANDQANNAEKAARPVALGNGATLVSPAGQILAGGAFTLGLGQQRYPATTPAGAPQMPPSAADVDDSSAASVSAPQNSPALMQPIAVNPAAVRSRSAVPSGLLSRVFNQAAAGSGNAANTIAPGNPSTGQNVMPSMIAPAAAAPATQGAPTILVQPAQATASAAQPMIVSGTSGTGNTSAEADAASPATGDSGSAPAGPDPSAIPTFDDEASARQAGYSTGDVVNIRIPSPVRLR